MILGTPKADWLAEFPRLADLIALRPSEWFNPAIAPSAEALADVGRGAPPRGPPPPPPPPGPPRGPPGGAGPPPPGRRPAGR
ncbi:hypothetical protein OFL47_23900, partial [Pseudomonas aeruginosa]|nr:hypothetical protein [Pseudomonas aeruginosa]